MAKSKKQSGSIFQIRDGVYAFGVPGQRAVAVVQQDDEGIRGVRGVKPIIGEGAKPATPSQEALDALARLTK